MKKSSLASSSFITYAVVALILVGAGYMIVRWHGRPQLHDESSFANINDVYTDHFHLDVRMNFQLQRLEGSNRLFLQTTAFFVSEVVLDVLALDIFSVSNGDGRRLEWEVRDPNPALGQALHISVPTVVFPGQTIELLIEFATTNGTTAISFLTPE